MSGWIAMDVYIRDPTADRYGIFSIFHFSSSEAGDNRFDSMTFVSIGVFTLNLSSSLNRATTESMYAVWESAIVRLGQLCSMHIPRSHFTSHRSTISKYFCSVAFALVIADGELAVTGMLSTWTAMMAVLRLSECVKMLCSVTQHVKPSCQGSLHIRLYLLSQSHIS